MHSCVKHYIDMDVQYSPVRIAWELEHYEINYTGSQNFLFDLWNDGNQEYLVLLNKDSRELRKINLEQRDDISAFNLGDSIINDEYGIIRSFVFHNDESVFILQDRIMSLISPKKILWAKIINTDSLFYKNVMLTNLDHAPMYFDAKNQSVSVQSYCHTCPVYSKEYYAAPVHYAVQLGDKTPEILDIGYSSRYKNKYWGFSNLIFRKEYEDRYLLGFSADPNIYIFDKINKKTKVYGGKSKFQYPELQPLSLKFKNDSNAKLKHLTLSPVYKEILFDAYRRLYYRFLLNGIAEKNNDGSYNGWKDKELILMIFDENFDLIKELKLGKGIYNSSKSFVGNNGLYLYKFPVDKSGEKLSYEIYKISRI